MPINIPNGLPAVKILREENVFIMTEKRAASQDIRPLKIAIFNLMPTKITTETQLIRTLSNSPLQIKLVLLNPKTHTSKNTSEEHLNAFYKTFDDIKDENFDGLIITGAPVEHLKFEEVDYWGELTEIMEWSKTHVTSTLYICWGAQAGLYYHYGVPKHSLDKKVFGIFSHKVMRPKAKLMFGFDSQFFAPHSRYNQIEKEDIKKVPELEILALSKEVGPYVIASKDGKHVFVLGHSEYDAETLHEEFMRDYNK